LTSTSAGAAVLTSSSSSFLRIAAVLTERAGRELLLYWARGPYFTYMFQANEPPMLLPSPIVQTQHTGHSTVALSQWLAGASEVSMDTIGAMVLPNMKLCWPAHLAYMGTLSVPN